MKAFRDLSIRSKLRRIIFIVSGFTLLVIFAFQISYNIRVFRHEVIASMETIAAILDNNFRVPLNFGYRSDAGEELRNIVGGVPDIAQAVIYDRHYEIFAGFSRNNEVVLPAWNEVSDLEGVTDDFVYINRPIQNEGTQIGTVFLKISTTSLQRKARDFFFIVSGVTLGVMLLSFLLAGWVQGFFTRPIIRLLNATGRVSVEGDYSLRVPKSGNDEIGDLYDGFNSMMRQIEQRDMALKEKTTQLEEAIRELRDTQDHLIQSEKMAALGQLIAGVAHEINSPLGAIRSSSDHMEKHLIPSIQNLPSLLEMLGDEERNCFFGMIRESVAVHHVTSAKEERKHRRSLSRELEEAGIVDPDSAADILVDMGLYQVDGDLLALLKTPHGGQILKAAYRISGLSRSARNILTATERASKIVFALKNYARYDPGGEMVMTDLTDGLETVLTLYYNQMKHGVELHRDFEVVPRIRCYPDQLNQVWTNLIHNALQAMEFKGELTIHLEPHQDGVRVRFIDSGHGIPGEIAERIFEPFFTTKPQGEGTGLGLDIVKKIIDKHCGTIEVDSEPGRTVFTIELPVDPKEKCGKAEGKNADNQTGHPVRG